MQREGLSHKEAERQFELPHNRAASWERIYLTKGPEGLVVERRGRSSKGRPVKLSPKVNGLVACNAQTTSPLGCLIKIFV